MDQFARKETREKKAIDTYELMCDNANPNEENLPMAITIEVNGLHKSPIKSYPSIAIDETEGLIILLTAPGCGTVLVPGRASYSTGYVGQYWKMERLTPFVGSLKMENK